MPFAYTGYEELSSPHRYKFTTYPCPQCQQTKQITVNANDLFRYHQGAFVQDAFPYLSAGDREQLFMSNICDVCFHAMFAEEEEFAPKQTEGLPDHLEFGGE